MNEMEISKWFASARSRCQYHSPKARHGWCKYTATRTCRAATCPFIQAIAAHLVPSADIPVSPQNNEKRI